MTIDNLYALDVYDFVPESLKNQETMRMVLDLFNVYFDSENSEAEFTKIREAYADITNRHTDFSKLSRPFQLELIKNRGMDYLVKLLENSAFDIARILPFLSAINALKGKLPGAKLILNVLGISYDIHLWDEPGVNLSKYTGQLTIHGAGYEYAEIFMRMAQFLRAYMLPKFNLLVELDWGGDESELEYKGSKMTLFLSPSGQFVIHADGRDWTEEATVGIKQGVLEINKDHYGTVSGVVPNGEFKIKVDFLRDAELDPTYVDPNTGQTEFYEENYDIYVGSLPGEDPEITGVPLISFKVEEMNTWIDIPEMFIPDVGIWKCRVQPKNKVYINYADFEIEVRREIVSDINTVITHKILIGEKVWIPNS